MEQIPHEENIGDRITRIQSESEDLDVIANNLSGVAKDENLDDAQRAFAAAMAISALKGKEKREDELDEAIDSI